MSKDSKKNYEKKEHERKEIEKLTGENFLTIAEDVIRKLKNEAYNDKEILTTSQLRNILSLNTYIYNCVLNNTKNIIGDEIDSDIKEKINYMKVRCIYEAGRDAKVDKFIKTSNLLEYIDNINGKKSNYLTFSRYLEALVAYRKFLVRGDE